MERRIQKVHKLPLYLGWGLGALAFVSCVAIDYLRQTDQSGDWWAPVAKGAVWGGLCAVVSGIVGYLVFLALGGHELYAVEEAPGEAAPAEHEEEIEGEGPGLDATGVTTTGQLIDLVSAPERPVPDLPPYSLKEPPTELEGFSPEEMARAVQAQLASNGARTEH